MADSEHRKKRDAGRARGESGEKRPVTGGVRAEAKAQMTGATSRTRTTTPAIRLPEPLRAALHLTFGTVRGLLATFVLLFLALSIAAPDRDFSDSENRSLATWPAFSLEALTDSSYLQGLSDYAADQFFGRDSWITLRLRASQTVGAKESSGVWLAEDGYLIEQPTGPNDEDVQANIDALNAFAAGHEGLSLNVVIVPNACSILSSKLPANAPVRDQRADLDRIASGLGEGVNFIGVYDDMAAHADDDKPLYYRTDHHWTSYGALCGFNAIAGALGIAPSVDYDVYTVSTTFQGTMASKSGERSRSDEVQIYVPRGLGDYVVTYESTQERSASMYVSEALEQKDAYQVFFGGNYPQVTIDTTNLDGRNLLILKDSYANALVQFLLPYYERIVLVDPRYYYDDLDTILTNEQITDVLVLYNLDTYLGDTSLDDTLATADGQ